MIRKGIHTSAVIDVEGQLDLPPTTILEPLAVFFIGSSGRLSLGERNIFYPHCSVRIDQGWMETGSDVSFGPGCHIYEPRGGLRIGNSCLIAGGVMICGAEHGTRLGAGPMRFQPAIAKPIIIEDDVWIGMGAVITPGVTIGARSVIGAGSVVTRDIPPDSVAHGVPCKVKRSREDHDKKRTTP